MSERISRTVVEENDSNIIKKQVENKLDDNIIRHPVIGLDTPAPEPPVYETLNVTENGTFTPEGDVNAFDEVVVNVPAVAPDEQLISEFDWIYNKEHNRNPEYDKINGRQSNQSYRSIELDENGYMQFNATNGYLWIPQYFGFNRFYKTEIDIIGKEFSEAPSSNFDLLKLCMGNNHVLLRWNVSENKWQLADWSGHVTYLEQSYNYFNNKKVDILFGCKKDTNGGYLYNSGYLNTYSLWYGNTELCHWQQSTSLTGSDNTGLIGLGHNTACVNFKFKNLKIYQLNNVVQEV